jgi:hypothetical protein
MKKLLIASLPLCLITSLAVITHAQVITRDRTDAPQPVGNALVSGSVMTDEATPQPVRRAQVSLVSAEAGFVVTKFAVTDGSGRFTIANLPAGRFSLAASKPGFVRVTYGAKRFDRPGTPITLADKQQMTGIALKMPRGGVIAGTITDETGLPAFGAQVRVLQYRIQQGERTLAPVMTSTILGEMTDDRGAYRIFGLPPGEYVVSATPRNATTNEIRAMTESEIRAALMALQQQQSGQQTPSGTGPKPPAQASTLPREDIQTVGYTAIYYPGTTTTSGAATVTLGPGEERTGVDFGLQLVRTAKIEGAVVAPPGIPPQSVQLTLLPAAQAGPPVLGAGIQFLNRVTPGPDGKFTYMSVPPGRYILNARVSRPGEGARGGGPPMVMEFGGRAGGAGAAGFIPDQFVTQFGGSAAAYWAMADLTVDGSPLSNVVLTMQPAMTLSGRVEFKSSRATPSPDLSRVRVSLAPVATGGGPTIMMGAPAAQMDPSGKFTLNGVTPGRYRMTGAAPVAPETGPGITWTLKSAIVKGRDALDFPLDIGPGEEVGDAVLTFTDATQQVTGVLQDASGRPAPDYTIVVYAADKAYWTLQSRRIRTARPGTDGRYTIANLPAGDYRIAALTDIAPGEANDPAFLEQLQPASYPFTLGDGERKVQDLRIAGGVL